VLDIAQLIRSPFRRCLPSSPLVGASFEVVDPPPEISLLYLACGWPPGANGSLPYEWRRLQGFRVEDPSGARKGGRTDAGTELGRPAWADRPGPAGPGPIRSGSVTPLLTWVLR
jgi:hypothetical protein